MPLFVDSLMEQNYQDPISLSPIYCAFKASNASSIYSYPFLNFFKKISMDDPLIEINLLKDMKNILNNINIELENNLSKCTVRLPSVNGGN
jgi:hypothetical protein